MPLQKPLVPSLPSGGQTSVADDKDVMDMKALQKQITALQHEVTALKHNDKSTPTCKHTMMSDALESEEKKAQTYGEHKEQMLLAEINVLKMKLHDLKQASDGKLRQLKEQVRALEAENRRHVARVFQQTELAADLAADYYHVELEAHRYQPNQQLQHLRQHLQAAKDNAADAKKAALDLIAYHRDIERSEREKDNAIKNASLAFNKLRDVVEKL